MIRSSEEVKNLRNHENGTNSNKKQAMDSHVNPSSEKKVKPNLETSSNIQLPSRLRGNTATNWDKFKDLVRDSNSENKVRVYKKKFNGITASTIKATPVVIENNKVVVKETKKNRLTKEVAMDCEMVGIGDGTESILARISLVNRYGDCIYDKYVKPREWVTDYRTAVSGIRPDQLVNGEDFIKVQQEIAEMLQGKILVGHAIYHDLGVLFLSHPQRHIRDTSTYKPFRLVSKGNTPSLKKLAKELLGLDIQEGEHNSVEDARTTMQLYMLYKTQWESDLRTRRRPS